MSETPPTRIAVIRNPISGLSSRHRLVPAFLRALGTGGAEVTPLDTEGPGHAIDLAREAGERGCDVVVAVGGDGTMNEVLNGLSRGGPALATFPAGTASVFARATGMPFSPEEAARTVLAGRRRRIDVGRVNGRRFLLMVSVGWDAHVVAEVARSRRGHLGVHRYVLPVLHALRDYRWPRLSVLFDGAGVPQPARLAFACNFRDYGGIFRIAPDAQPDDGLLDFATFRRGGARDSVRWAVGALLGTLPRLRETEFVRGRTLVVTSDEPVPFQVDGDPGGVTPVTIETEPDALEVIVP
ncbi:MAG: diacylglycerol kinase family protein [Planctomycetota bacterium]